TVTQSQTLGTVESVKAVSEMLSPVSGEVIEVNDKISSNPELVNKDPYGEGWIAIIKSPNIDADLKNLMTAEQYATYVKQLLEASRAT
ncbi:MAG: glycine cleavage system protein H, partial [Candidatus Bathyarchaeia archaeon]